MKNEEKLLLAAENGDIDSVKELIESLDFGVDVNTQNDDGWTALLCASKNGHMCWSIIFVPPTTEI